MYYKNMSVMGKTISWVTLVAAVALVATMALFLYMPHHVDNVYLEQEGVTYCVKNDISWTSDTTAYCSTDVDLAGQMLVNLKRVLLRTGQATTIALPPGVNVPAPLGIENL